MQYTLDTIRDIKILQSSRGYRFTIDSLLLVDFINLKYPKLIADFGAGSGIIGIMLAKRFPKARICLTEVQHALSDNAEKNIEFNMVGDRVCLYRNDINNIYDMDIEPNSFDLVVSNPPFRKQSSGRISPYGEKAIARHELSITLKQLINAAFYLLRGKGRFCFIFHPERLIEVIEGLKERGFEPKRIRFVHSNKYKEAKMFLIEAVKEGNQQLTIEKPFFIYNRSGEYIEEALRVINGKGNIEKVYNLSDSRKGAFGEHYKFLQKGS